MNSFNDVFFIFSLAEKLSDRVHALEMRLTNTSEVEEKIENVENSLRDLTDYVEKSMKNSEATIAKLPAIREAIQNIKVISVLLFILPLRRGLPFRFTLVHLSVCLRFNSSDKACKTHL